jgi:hypothetical protein
MAGPVAQAKPEKAGRKVKSTKPNGGDGGRTAHPAGRWSSGAAGSSRRRRAEAGVEVRGRVCLLLVVVVMVVMRHHRSSETQRCPRPRLDLSMVGTRWLGHRCWDSMVGIGPTAKPAASAAAACSGGTFLLKKYSNQPSSRSVPTIESQPSSTAVLVRKSVSTPSRPRDAQDATTTTTDNNNTTTTTTTTTTSNNA